MEHWALEHNLGHISVWIVVRNNYLKPASTIKYNVQFSQESISELAVSFNESIPKHSFLIRPLSYEQHPVPEERGVGRGNAVNAGELLLEQQIVLRHQGVLQEVGAVAVLTLHTLHYSTALLQCPQVPTLCVAVFLSIILAASCSWVSMSGTEGSSLAMVSWAPALEVAGSRREMGLDMAATGSLGHAAAGLKQGNNIKLRTSH